MGENYGGEPAGARERQAKHWSQIEPISSNEVRPDEYAQRPNAADGVLDEEAEAAAFKAAVAEWRGGGASAGKVQIEWENKARAAAEPQPDDGMWRNPWAGQPDQTPRGAMGEDEESARPLSSSGGRLADGMLNEAFERAEFAKAVSAWRSGGAEGDKVAAVSSEESQQAAVDKAAKKAEELAKQMEAQYEATARTIQERRSVAEARLQAASKDAELARRRFQAAESKAAAERLDDSLEDDSDGEYPRVAISLASTSLGQEDSEQPTEYVVEECDSD